MATRLGQNIGKPWEVTEGSDIGGQDLTRNVSFQVQQAQGEEADTTVAGGEVTIRALVRVSFQLE
jgi:uncharacterized protein YggE